ncbi:type IX secretion system sortase PorU [Catalinimonas niigatensis]|uniref:type IX secretion system sortase PorU n=1 Tax=Catalinimonas niigatensis TaxID=1397264 RepID=UPI0026651939|nr:type IX secretion system sortase PorU [Catalinimonas niigatensis]WPP49878.1 type IX secretion system sortase PorU [Catalinimonas niigatensis]
MAQEISVLSTGQWYKFSVPEAGVYKISGAQLAEKGIDIRQIDPQKLGIFGYGGGMLAQPLAKHRYHDLPEVAIYLSGVEDGKFNAEDELLFFAQGPDYLQFVADTEGKYNLQFQKNLYADSAYYFLTTTEGKGIRLVDLPQRNLSNAPLITIFDDYWVHELDEHVILQPGSGREWYGEVFYNGDVNSFAIPTEIATSGEIVLELNALGRTTIPSHFEILLNNQLQGTLELDPILSSTYTDKGKESSIQLVLPSDQLTGKDQLELSLKYTANGDRGQAHLNRFLLSFPRTLNYQSEQLLFRSIESTKNTTSTFQINASVSDAIIWDVSNPLVPAYVQADYSDGKYTFEVDTQSELREFVVFDPAELPQAQWVGQVENQNLSYPQVPDLLIICPPFLKNEAERLAAFRRQHDQLEVEVATTEQVYNQFSSGRQDISAIRNLAKSLYDRQKGKLKYLLLFGKSSYDYKDRVDNNTNLVPTYQSRNAVHPIYSYPSDDYYAFMEEQEGEWEESYRGDHTMDIGVGRLPVKSLQEAQIVVDKLTHYATSEQAFGNWRTRIAFLADDGDNDRYQKDSEQLSEGIFNQYSGFSTQKIYLDAFPQEKYPNQELAPQVNQAVEDVINNGVLLFNYVGHGNEQRLADENVFNVGMISKWDNLDKLPFFVTATCEFGRHDDPNRISGAEELLLNPKGGAIGLVTTARPVFSNTNYLLNLAFYEHIFERVDGEYQRIGDVFMKTKNEALNGRDNRNFSLLADPSMRLAYPHYQIDIDSVLSLSDRKKTDTLKALSEIRFYGEIRDQKNGQRVQQFDGELTLVLHDKPFTMNTRGNEGTVMQFKETNNVIHRGRASVKNGRFIIDFVVPKNITYSAGIGRVSMYAQPKNGKGTDAFGGADNLVVGGSDTNAPIDQSGPEISLYLDDSSFVSGDVTGSTPVLLARLWDEQGINLSRQQTGQEIMASLQKIDGNTPREISLNEFFVTDIDLYQSGTLRYPLGYLEDGKYVLSLQAWDTHNNRSSSSIEFFVSDSDALTIQSFYNYPNPFHQSTLFILDHNRSGEDLSVSMQIFDREGKQILDIEKQYLNSESRLNLLDWKLEGQSYHVLTPGIYVVNIRVKSLVDMQEAEENLKIILTN